MTDFQHHQHVLFFSEIIDICKSSEGRKEKSFSNASVGVVANKLSNCLFKFCATQGKRRRKKVRDFALAWFEKVR